MRAVKRLSSDLTSSSVLTNSQHCAARVSTTHFTFWPDTITTTNIQYRNPLRQISIIHNPLLQYVHRTPSVQISFNTPVRPTELWLCYYPEWESHQWSLPNVIYSTPVVAISNRPKESGEHSKCLSYSGSWLRLLCRLGMESMGGEYYSDWVLERTV